MPQPLPHELFYDETPGKIRENANLPGSLILPLTQLEGISTYLHKMHDQLYVTDDEGNPDPDDPGIENPIDAILLPMLQLTRSEGMKGSEQVVRMGVGQQGGQLGAGVGLPPNLAPSLGNAAGPTILIQNGIQRAAGKKGIGRRLFNVGPK